MKNFVHVNPLVRMIMFVTLLLPAWQGINAETDKSCLLPFEYFGRRYGECEWDENKTISYWGLDNKNASVYEYYKKDDNGKVIYFGFAIERKYNGYKPIVYMALKCARTLPPYAQDVLDWDFTWRGGNDGSDRKTKCVVYAAGDSLNALTKKWNNDPDCESSTNADFKDYTIAEIRNSYSNWDDDNTIVESNAAFTFDNSENGSIQTVQQWVVTSCAFHGSGGTNQAKGALNTRAYKFTRTYPKLHGAGTQESPLQISSGYELKIFSEIVNSGAEGTADLYAVLTNDIDYTSYTNASAIIGSKSHPYKGIFDGQGHSVMLALNSSEEYTGLFGCTDGATIKNLELVGSVVGQRVVGSLVGEMAGSTTLENIISKVDISSAIPSEVNGLFGCAGNGSTACTLTITNCAFLGDFIGDVSNTTISGFGYVRYYCTTNIKNCYVALSEDISCKKGNNFCRWADGSEWNGENCYYTHKIKGDTQGTQVTDKQVQSGELCYLLNGKVDFGEPWLQTLGIDKTPTLWNAMRVCKKGNEYYNFEPSFRGAGTEQDPFQIETLQELEKFRDIVNAGYNKLCAKIVADINLANHNWIPIGHGFEKAGTTSYPYSGIFDGNGYIISNLNVNPEDEDVVYCGLFGHIQNATIKNIIIEHATIVKQPSERTTYTAPVVAYASESNTIINCGVMGIVTLGGQVKSGIALVENNKNNKMQNCYSVYKGALSGKSTDAIENCYDGYAVETLHASGELTFKLNNGSTTPWVQTLDRDPYPLLRGALSVYKSATGFYNDEYTGSNEEGFMQTTSGKDFRIIHHGGRLYEFIITMATQDGAAIYTCPKVEVRYSAENGWHTICTLSDVNADSLQFSKNWWGRISMNEGVMYDSKSYHRQVPTFWIRQGNHTTLKQTSLLWVAPDSLNIEPRSFMLKGSAGDSQLNITSSVEDAELSDDSGFTVTDPMVGVDQSIPGASHLMIAGSNTIYGYGIWDATDNYFIATEECPEGVTSVNALLPQYEGTHDIHTLLYTRSVAYDDNGKADTTFVVYDAPVSLKPSHSFVRTNVDKASGYNSNNQLKWAFAFPNDVDILADDVITVERSENADYSKGKNVGEFGLMDFTTTATEKDSLMGWFTFKDTSEDAKYSTVSTTDKVSAFDTWNLTDAQRAKLCAYKYPARYLYYKVYRSTFGSVWSTSDLYNAYWKVLMTHVLPTVDTVRIIKDEDYEMNHKVKVRIVLNNPYPWDVVDAADRNAVYAEAERQGFTRRMFTWDKNASIVLTRFSTEDEYDAGVDVIEKTVTISGDKVQQNAETGEYYVDYDDVASLPFVHYYYKAKVDNGKSNYPICEDKNIYALVQNPCYSEHFGVISNLQATRGTLSGAVEVTWEADETSQTTLELKRREYQRGFESEKELAGWTSIAAAGGTAVDENAVAAVVNEYILTITTRYRDIVYAQSDTTYGYAAYYGALEGRVKMANGVNMPGDVRVMVERDKPFDIQEVRDPRNGEVVLPTFHLDMVKYTLPTDKTGNYALDSIPYYGTGMQYNIYAACGTATFVSPTGTSASVTLTYEDTNYEYADIDFTCNDTKHVSGRILYTNSTTPVRDVQFFINGTVLRGADGEAVTTDATGNFSFIVPRMEVTMKAYKAGHKMTNEGYILGGESGEERTFTPTKDYDGLVIYDDTKVRLVGRVAGGDIQGMKPLGFGLSGNNLGDSITVVLQLDGDNTSYLYYDKKNPESKSYTASFAQQVYTTSGTEEQRIPTHATFESKRIMVKADNKTGEFCIDLFPAKYKVAQIYANGYSSLYGEGEGMAVMDLTDSVGLHVHFADEVRTKYDASFRKIYHAPVQVDLLQLQNNKYKALYGEQNMEVGMLTGTNNMQLAWLDTAEVAHYTFGYPVYKSNKTSYFMVQAYEAYYYNNNALGSYERVPMAGYEVTVNNGFNGYNENDEDDDEDGLVLNATGSAMFSIVPNNTTFSLAGEEALRHLSASVNINGYHYESEPIAAYITGNQQIGVEVMASIETAPQILDYIRDPYGEESYAYRTEGTTYNWARHYASQKTSSFVFDFEGGIAFLSSFGFGKMEQSEYDWVILGGNVTKITENDLTYKDGEFSLTLSNQLNTSDNPMDQGAAGDVYLGTVSTADVVKYQSFNVVDSLTFDAIKPAIESGVSKFISEGVDENGHPSYLVISGGVTWTPGKERIFAYAQSHITDVIIPNLEARRDEALRVASSLEEASSMAETSGHAIYYLNKNGDYIPVYPSTMKVKTDSVDLLNTRISEWENLIAENERQKYEVMTKEANMKYSLACTTFEHSEEASTYYRVRTATGPKPCTFTLSTGESKGTVDGAGAPASGSQFRGIGAILNLSFGGGEDEDTSDDYENYTTINGGSGFVITAIDNNYYDLDIYYQNDESLVKVNDNFKNDINSYEGGSGVDDYKLTSDALKMADDNTYVHNYVFVMRGGATRQPWIDADSTLYYKPDGESVALGVRTLKVDNPKIYIENPVVNNLPQDEKAVFTLHLSNETEMTGNVEGIISSLFLHVNDDSNPYGAKLSIDGVPLRNNMEFFLNPGETITKTLEVERGSSPHDYDEITLEFSDEIYLMNDAATLSVHYLPTSSPVKLTQPAQNFLINTLSQTDDDGKYYIPAQIEGFSTTKYDNFDHIEFQYKRQTDGEDQWVNLCSYYSDPLLYAVATGTKQMIETEGTISNIRFYGEKDPVEMKYDLRAVTFCRLGNGFTTRTSEVISGTKDTRCPEVFGLPKPTDGILDFDGMISLPFTEPIAYNYLDETANFSIQGYTNNSDVNNSVSLYFSGDENQNAVSSVNRVLNQIDFSVEMNVQPSEQQDPLAFITVADEYNNINEQSFFFGYMPAEDRLVAYLGGDTIYSQSLKANYDINLTSAMTHVGMTYSAEDNEVRFFVGEQWIDLTPACSGKKYHSKAQGTIKLGYNYQGKMGNVRLWSKALSTYEMSSKYKKTLSANESDLLGYWPTDEAVGNMVYDVVHGANITLSNVSWNLPNGFSVALDHETLPILSDQALKFTRDRGEDFTLSFWFKAEAADGDADLFAAGGDNLEEKGMDKVRIRFMNGGLYYVSEGNNFLFGDADDFLLTPSWHYLAATVNHAQNKFNLFVDGMMVAEADADAVGGVASSSITFGSTALKAHFDNINLFSMALPASYIKQYYNKALTGTEHELLVNMNFEQDEENEQGTMITVFSPYNQVIVKETGEIAGDKMVAVAETQQDSKETAPVSPTTGLQNLPFSWNSTDNELQININKSLADINKQQINLVVRNVEDLNGNVMKNAQMWSVYVNRNVLEWALSDVVIVKPSDVDTTAILTWSNKSGRKVSYTIQNNASWLKLSNTKGIIEPLTQGYVAFTIEKDMAPGNYCTEVSLIDEDNLISKLNVQVMVTTEAPDWEVTTDPGYNETMNVVGVVKKETTSGTWYVDMRPDDFVGAFINNICVGKANLSVDATTNTSYVFLNIRGNSNLNNTPVEFRLWSTADGQIYSLDTDSVILYKNKAIVGATKPVEMRTSQRRYQSIDLKQGWNWISLNVKPNNNVGANNLFYDQSELTAGDVLKRTGNNPALFTEDGVWDATLDAMQLNQSNVYQIYAQKPATVIASGTAFTDENREITLTFGNSNWAEMAYLLETAQPINTALSDFVAGSDKAPAGTLIKSHDEFAVARSDGKWFGSLQYLTPGVGYYVTRNGLRDAITINYYTSQAMANAPVLSPSSSVLRPSSTSMPIIATFAEGEYEEGDVLVAIANGEVVGVAEATALTSNLSTLTSEIYFLSASAEDGSNIQFVKMRDGEPVAVSTRKFTYNADLVAGTLEHPYVVDFTATEGNDIYDLSGIKHFNTKTLNQRGIYIQNGRKVSR